jgi:excisionase family DNA binding protein
MNLGRDEPEGLACTASGSTAGVQSRFPLSGGVSHLAEPENHLLTPSEVANLFRVDPKTVTRWAAAGRIRSLKTPGGRRRFRESGIRALMNDLRAEE